MSFKRYYLPLKGRVELPFLLAYRRTKFPVTLNDTSFYIRNSYSIRRFITTGNTVRNPIEEEEFEAKTTKRKRKKNVRINLDDFLKGSTITTSNESSEKDPAEEPQTLLEDPQPIEESELDMPGTKLLRLVREYQLNNPQYVLLTRVGDFYELYYEQADEIGPLLDITVIDRQFKKQKVKFTGFPARHLEKYLEMLVSKLGKSVAMCEQFQDPVTKYYSRRVSRIITPGTLINEQFLDPCEHNYLLSVEGDVDSNSMGLAWVDLSTGDFMVEESSPKSFLSDLARIQPREIVLNESLKAETHPMHQLIQKTASYLTTY
ncbi:MutS protein 1, partial [Basidiobolus ranarum]